MSYEQLDAIADAYIPLLLILFLVVLIKNAYVLWPNYRVPAISFLYLISLLSISYGIMFFDNTAGLWPSIGMDYSTHTAVALSLVCALCRTVLHLWKWLIGSLLAYMGLMLYQDYHSILDIVSTAVVIASFALVIKKFIL